jgi:hypothetical protein
MIHDHAFALALVQVDLITNLIRPEERREVFDAFYEAAKAAIRRYEASADRMQRRLKPSSN